MNKYIIALLLSVCAFNSYGMLKKKSSAPATPPVIPRSEAQKQKSYEEVDRQIIGFHLKRKLDSSYATPIEENFAARVRKEYDEDKIKNILIVPFYSQHDETT